MTIPLETVLVNPRASIREAIARIDRGSKGIVLVVDEARKLIGTITDGDIRRAILANVNLDGTVRELLARRSQSYPTPVTALVGTPQTELLRIMKERVLRHIPLVDGQGCVVDLVVMNELIKDYELPLRAVVMAGGYGNRMRPLTEELPKVMLPIGERPLLELMLHQLRDAGIRQVNLTTHYKAELITEYFGNGSNFGLEIQYVKEDQPLGTAGALSLLDPSDQPLLVVNGDLVTEVDFGAMLSFHREHKADMTVAIRQHEMSVPYGVVETDGVLVTGILEKPVVRHFINAGIYLLNPSACRFIPRGQHYNMTDLINRLLAEKCRVVSFPIREYWIDVGHMENYQKVLSEVASKSGQER